MLTCEGQVETLLSFDAAATTIDRRGRRVEMVCTIGLDLSAAERRRDVHLMKAEAAERQRSRKLAG